MPLIAFCVASRSITRCGAESSISAEFAPGVLSDLSATQEIIGLAGCDLDQDLLLRLGKTTPQGTRPLAFGLAQSETDLQDLCAATAAWSEPAQLGAAGQFAAAAGPEENYPTSFGRSLARGAVQGRLSSDGAYLLQLSLLAVIDLSQEEAKTGVPPTEACAQWATSLGYDPCGPCGPPADGVVGTPTCITTLWEWALAPRTETSLIPIDSPGPDCPEGEDL